MRLETKIKEAAESSATLAQQIALFDEVPPHGVWDYLFALHRVGQPQISDQLKTAMLHALPKLRAHLCGQFLKAIEARDISALNAFARAVEEFNPSALPADPTRERVLRMKRLLDERHSKMTLTNLVFWLDALDMRRHSDLELVLSALRSKTLHKHIPQNTVTLSENGHATLRRICKEINFPLASQRGRRKSAQIRPAGTS